ncbi:MAG: HypC/HybG/HupF family hydrogenase formation chaperone [Bacteroidota bacterium]
MGVLTGKIVEIYLEDGKTMGKVRVGAATTNVGLILLMEAKVHDRVLIDSGIALAKVKEKKAVVE